MKDVDYIVFNRDIKNLDDYLQAKTELDEIKNKLDLIVIEKKDNNQQEQMEEQQMEEQKRKMRILKSYMESFCTLMEEYSSKYLGENIKYLLSKHKMRISDLETILQVSPGYISRTINVESKKRLSIDIVWKIAKLFEVNVDELLNKNFCEPSQAILPVIKFIKKLKKDTDDLEISWKNVGEKPTEVTSLLFGNVLAESSEDNFYSPDGYEAESNGIVVTGNIYMVNINDCPMYVVPIQDVLSGELGVDIFVREYMYNEYEGGFYYLTLICRTMNDRTGTLYFEIEQLINTIKLHEDDFRISDNARNFINKYMDPNYQEDLSF